MTSPGSVFQECAGSCHENVSAPMLLADVTLRCGMYPAGKVDISQHLAIPRFPQSDHTVDASPVRMLVHCVVKHSRPPETC